MSNKKFAEIQKNNNEILKKRVEAYSSSDESDVENTSDDTGKAKIEAIFKNYHGDESQTKKLYEYFEHGENKDCLICKN